MPEGQRGLEPVLQGIREDISQLQIEVTVITGNIRNLSERMDEWHRGADKREKQIVDLALLSQRVEIMEKQSASVKRNEEHIRRLNWSSAISITLAIIAPLIVHWLGNLLFPR